MVAILLVLLSGCFKPKPHPGFLYHDGSLPNGVEVMPDGRSPIEGEMNFTKLGYNTINCDLCNITDGGYSKINPYKGEYSMEMRSNKHGHWIDIKKFIGNTTNVTCEAHVYYGYTPHKDMQKMYFLMEFFNYTQPEDINQSGMEGMALEAGLTNKGNFTYRAHVYGNPDKNYTDVGIAWDFMRWYKVLVTLQAPELKVSFYNMSDNSLIFSAVEDISDKPLNDGISTIVFEFTPMPIVPIFFDEAACWHGGYFDKPTKKY